MQIRKHFRFEAAHRLPHHRGKCARPHGHSYRVEVAVRGPLQRTGPATGMVLDFDDLASTVDERVIARLDHTDLGETVDNPTAENVALWIWHELRGAVDGLDEIVVWETPTACAVVRADDAGDR